MNYRPFVKVILVSVLAIGLSSLATSALAGGWAVVTLKELPDHAVVGQPFMIDFMVRQHGRTPWVNDAVAVLATEPQSGFSLTVKGTADPDTPGHYTASLEFPRPGRWRWAIQSGLFPDQQPMPDLEVIPSSTANPVATSNISTPLMAGFAGLVLAVIIGVWLRRRKTYLTAGALVICLGLSVFAFTRAAMAARTTVEIQTVKDDVKVPLSQAELGRRLFLAKGCVVCHLNRNAGTTLDISVELGPDLTQVTKDAQYLEYWLADPAAVKPDTEMPRLDLNQIEIEALIAFLKSPK